MSPEQNKTKPDSSLHPLVDSKSLLGQSRLEPSDLRERLGLIQEDVASSCIPRDKFSPIQDRPESSTVLKDTPGVLLKERSGVGSPAGTRDQKTLLPNSSQDELMEVEKSEQPLSQVLPSLSPEHKEMPASNFESSPEIEERPAVLSALDQSQSQPSKAAETPAVASCWGGPQVSPEHKELSHSPPRENSFESSLEFRNSGPVSEVNTGFSPEVKEELNGPSLNQTEADPSLDVKEQSTRSSRRSSSELSPEVGVKVSTFQRA